MSAMYLNLASVFAEGGQLAQAGGLARQALGLDPGSQQALLLLTWVELLAGNAGSALSLLREGRDSTMGGGAGATAAATTALGVSRLG